jgi:hypothetical protein
MKVYFSFKSVFVSNLLATSAQSTFIIVIVKGKYHISGLPLKFIRDLIEKTITKIRSKKLNKFSMLNVPSSLKGLWILCSER